jgi:hypothetical protein
MNYTLALDDTDNPIVAASMFTTWGGGYGRNTIVLVWPGITPGPISYPCFPISFPAIPNDYFNINVRDFQYIPAFNKYVLCGSRETETYSRAFFAVIEGNFTAMEYNEYPEADIFYSLWADDATYPTALNYLVCGSSSRYGAIASISHIDLSLSGLSTTNIAWEYNKIIAVSPYQHYPRFVVSGKDPGCTQIGFTAFDYHFSTINNYVWEQLTEPASLCVVGNHITNSNRIIIASSYQASLTLNPIDVFGPLFTWISAYQFGFISTQFDAYKVQDIGLFVKEDVENPRISVVGFFERTPSAAWHGHLFGLNATNTMTNNYFFGPTGSYKHYKVKCNQQGDDFTGGHYQSGLQMGALFGTPLTPAWCDNILPSGIPGIIQLPWTSFSLVERMTTFRTSRNIPRETISLPAYIDCTPFKGDEETSE